MPKAEKLAAELNGSAVDGGPGDADVVVLTLPYPANLELARHWSGDLVGKIVIDVANPVDSTTFDRLVTPPGMSSAQQVAEAAPGARVVKAFNTTFAGNLKSGVPLDIFIAGDDDGACRTVAVLAADGGLRPLLVGGLKHAQTLEGMQLLHMRVQDQIDGNWVTAIAVTA